MKKNNKKGFTLMEMLIVVAIIGILVAIAIPTFTGALNKAKEAADVANIRAEYARQVTANLTEDTEFEDYAGPDLNFEEKLTWTPGDTLSIEYKGDYSELTLTTSDTTIE